MCVCVLYIAYRLTWDVMQVQKPSNIKTKPNKTQQNQTKQVKITKTKNINVCTNNNTAYDSYALYCKFTNSNKQFCGRSNHASIAKLLTRYHLNTYLNTL